MTTRQVFTIGAIAMAMGYWLHAIRVSQDPERFARLIRAQMARRDELQRQEFATSETAPRAEG